ncbi:MAG: hypothetical protein WB681_12610 [Candidatus Cybelea sp.]
MAARLESLQSGSSRDPGFNAIIDFSKTGLGGTCRFGLLGLRPEARSPSLTP